MKDKIFTWAIKTKGSLTATFEFESLSQADDFCLNEIPKLQNKYGKITYTYERLDGLKVGDTCQVWGEGTEEFKIVDIKRLSPNRYSFLLDAQDGGKKYINATGGKHMPQEISNKEQTALELKLFIMAYKPKGWKETIQTIMFVPFLSVQDLDDILAGNYPYKIKQWPVMVSACEAWKEIYEQ